MTPKEKCDELIEKYSDIEITFEGQWGTLEDVARKCALICVDEMIVQNGELYLSDLGNNVIDFYRQKNSFLFDVKTEIEKL